MSITFTYLRQPLNRYTFKAPKTRAWVEEQCKGKCVLNLFAGPTRLNGCMEVANDIDPNAHCTHFGWMPWNAPNTSGKKASHSMLFS